VATENRDDVISMPAFDDKARPIWEELEAIGKQAPAGTWDAVPEDLSMRVDDVICGRGKSGR